MCITSLKVNMLGGLSIRSGDVEINDGDNRSRKVWLLLAYMIYCRKRPITQEELVRLLWDDADSVTNPANALKTMFHRVRTTLDRLGDSAGHILIVRQGGSYAWNCKVPLTLDVEEFDELCDFLREQKLLRAGVFPYSPEEGTRAAKMERVDSDEAARRAERIVDIQSEIIDAWNDERQGDVMEVLCEGFDGQSMLFVGRSYAESPDIDGRIYFSAPRDVAAGEFVPVRITGAMDGELTGELAEE